MDYKTALHNLNVAQRKACLTAEEREACLQALEILSGLIEKGGLKVDPVLEESKVSKK